MPHSYNFHCLNEGSGAGSRSPRRAANALIIYGTRSSNAMEGEERNFGVADGFGFNEVPLPKKTKWLLS